MHILPQNFLFLLFLLTLSRRMSVNGNSHQVPLVQAALLTTLAILILMVNNQTLNKVVLLELLQIFKPTIFAKVF